MHGPAGGEVPFFAPAFVFGGVPVVAEFFAGGEFVDYVVQAAGDAFGPGEHYEPPYV